MKISHIFNSQTKTVQHAAGILIVSALASRLLAIARDWLLANNLGAGPDLDVYFAVFRIPDFIYHILISGGIIVAFLPIFSDFFSKNKDEAWKFSNNLLNIFLFFLIAFSVALFIFTPFIVKLITPGFTAAQIDQTIFLTRLMFLSPIFFGLSSIFSGILQYFHRFLFYSFAPILYNFGIILGILFLFPYFGVTGIIYGVLLGAFMHFAVQLPAAINCGFRYRPIFNLAGEGIRKVFLLMLPRTLGVAGSQINLIVMTAIASSLSAGSISIFNLSQNLQNIPIGIIGVSFAVAVFAPLSKSLADGVREEFLNDFSSTFRQIIYIILPFNFLLFIMRNQIVEIILRHGEFNRAAAELTAAGLGLFCLGIWAIALVPLISRAFFALKDTKIPAIVVLATITLNIILGLYFISAISSDGLFKDIIRTVLRLSGDGDMRVLGLPLAYAISGILQFILLLALLYKRVPDIRLADIWKSSFKMLIASLIMAAVVYIFIYFLSSPYLEAIIGGLVGIIVYFAATSMLKLPETKAIKSKVISILFRNKMSWRE